MAVQDFAAPVSLDEALPAFAGEISRHGWRGTDLLVGMRLGAKNPDRIVDLKRIPELMAIVEDESAVRLGAAVASYDLVRHPSVAGLYPGLAEALDLIGSTQIQGRCSAGGNLCNASPAADSIPALIANNASCRIIGPEGERLLPVEQFVTGPGSTALTSGELLVELILPRPPERGSDAYLRLTPPPRWISRSRVPVWPWHWMRKDVATRPGSRWVLWRPPPCWSRRRVRHCWVPAWSRTP